MLTHFTTAVCTSALVMALAPLGSAQDARADNASPRVQRLGAPAGASAFQGLPDDFGARIDADGDLTVTTDPINLTAGVVSISNVAFEEGNLLTVPGQTVANITHVFDAAVEGSRAAVLVGVSGNAYHLLEFTRINILGNVSWIFNSSADVTAAVSAPGIASAGFVDLVNGDAAVVIEGGNWDYYARFTTSPLTYVPNPGSFFFQTVNLFGFESVSMAVAPPPQFPGPSYGDATQFLAWGGVDGSSGSNDAVRVLALDTSSFDIIQNIVEPAGREFGAAVALHDDLLFIGVPGDDTLGTDTGCVELWRFSGVNSYGKLLTIYSPRPQPGDRFGRSLDVSPDGTTLAIGELQNEAIPGASDSGVIRLASIPPNDIVTVTHDVFALASTLAGSDENLGVDIDWASDDLLAAGEPLTGGDGSIWWFPQPPAPWIELDQSPALAGGSGEPKQVLEGAIFSDGALLIGVEEAEPFSTTYLIIGLSQLNAPAKGGIVYPALDLVKAFPTNAAGERIIPTLWLETSVALGPFDTYIQWWTADPGAPVGFSATGGGVIHQY